MQTSSSRKLQTSSLRRYLTAYPLTLIAIVKVDSSIYYSRFIALVSIFKPLLKILVHSKICVLSEHLTIPVDAHGTPWACILFSNHKADRELQCQSLVTLSRRFVCLGGMSPYKVIVAGRASSQARREQA